MSQPDEFPQIEGAPAEAIPEFRYGKPVSNIVARRHAEPDGPSPLWLPVFLLVGFCFTNFFFLPATQMTGPDGWLPIGLAAGVLPAEMLIMAMWLVWGPGNFLPRLAVHWAIGLVLMAFWSMGLLLAAGNDREIPAVLRATLLGLFPVSLAVQLPLWPLRTHFGWRAMRSDASQPDRPLSIGDMLAGTAVTALSISAIRFAFGDANYPRPENWIGWGIGLASGAGISVITAPVAMGLLLRKIPIGVGIGLMTGYAILAMVITMAVIGVLAGGRIPFEPLGVLGAAILSFAYAICAALIIARVNGFRLFYRNEQPPAQS